MLLVLRHSLLHDEGPKGVGDNLPGRVWDMASMWAGIFAASEDGGIDTPKAWRRGEPFCIAAYPKQPTGDDHFALMLHSDGTSLYCETAGEDDRLTAEFLTARGTAGKFTDLLRQPGMSQSGHLWMWLEQTSTTVTLSVVDEQGKPCTGVHVLCGPIGFDYSANSSVELPIAVPIAIGATQPDGRATLRGPLSTDARLSLRRGDAVAIAARIQIRHEGGQLRVIVPERAFLSQHANANEAAAIATLKNICSAQAQCQASGVIDGNGNGAGEYGFFGELSGAVVVRNDEKGGVGNAKIVPPVLSFAFSKVKGSRVERSGYIFQIFLPAADGSAVGEAETGGAAGVTIDPRRAETTWCAYAWPISEQTGRRCFFVNQSGDVSATNNEAQGYAGVEKPPLPTAAFAKGSSGKLDAPMAANAEGGDGGHWRIVQ